MFKGFFKYLHSNLYETNSKEDCLKAMNELLYTTIYNRDLDLEKSIEEFYYNEFSKQRRETKENRPVVYSNLLYEANYNFVSRIVDNNGTVSKIIEHRATSGIWLLGEVFYNKISNETYIWLWRNTYLIIENEIYVKNYWENVSVFFDYSLKSIYKEYDTNYIVINDEEIEIREKERIRFLEFQYVFVGLLLSKKKYASLNFVLTHTRSMPADYSLLPKNIDDVFRMFKYFNQDFKTFGNVYYYPEVDWVNSEETIKKWVNFFISILFLKEYVLKNMQGFPQLEGYTIYQRRILIQDIPLLQNSLKQILKNNELQKQLAFLYYDGEEIFRERKQSAIKYLDDFTNKISESIDVDIAKSELKQESIISFYDLSKETFTKSFELLNEFKNINIYENDVEHKKYYIRSFKEIVSKSPFIENDFPYMNFNEAYVETWSRGILQIFVNTLTEARTRSYLVKKDDFTKAISKLNIDNDFIIIGVNLVWDVEQAIQNYKGEYKPLKVAYSTISNALYILRKNDLPFIEHKDLNPDEKRDYKLDEVINEDYKIYSKVLDLNKEPSLREKLIESNSSRTQDELVKCAIISVGVNTEIIWKKDAEVVQLSLQSQYTMERGILNDIDDLIPFKI